VACTLGGDIAHYLSLAQQDRGSGNYTSAVRLFRQILACEPNNAAARDGLARAIQGQEQGRH
jgi:cytochrome c-type biogenesis protein CcmH/NrfG